MKRIGGVTLAAILGLVVWYSGPAWRPTSQQAFAQQITPLPNSVGANLQSYYDVSTSFSKSESGYGGAGHSGGAGDALLRIENTGNFGADATAGEVCANIYVFDDIQEMQECCQCPLTADSVRTLSVITDLTSNPSFKGSLGAGTIKILGVAHVQPSVCPSAGTIPTLAQGLSASLNHTESIASNNPNFTPPFGFVTSTSVEVFTNPPIDNGELSSLFSQCNTITKLLAGRGVCTCGLGS